MTPRVRSAWSSRERSCWRGRSASPAYNPPRDRTAYWRFYGVAIVLVGVGWAAGGIAQVT